jgi:2-isopropylmalate synthase
MGALNKLIAARDERIKAEAAAYAGGYDTEAPRYEVGQFAQSADS